MSGEVVSFFDFVDTSGSMDFGAYFPSGSWANRRKALGIRFRIFSTDFVIDYVLNDRIMSLLTSSTSLLP